MYLFKSSYALAFAGMLFLQACSGSLKDMHTDLGIDKISSNIPTDAHRNWKYDAQTNNIQLADSNWQGESLVLVFADFPTADNPRGEQPIAQAAIAEPSSNKGAFAKPLTINGRLLTINVDGFLAATGERVLEFTLEDGKRCGDYYAKTASQKEYQNKSAACTPKIDVGTARKPVLYLYPETPTEVSVKVHFKGELTHTYPKYDPAKGWKVLAQPNGELTDLNTRQTYYELFWEGQSAYRYPTQTGFCVAKADIIPFLDAKTEELGLNRREANEFITYWLPELEKNAYTLIHFATQSYSEQARLEISPRPDTEIRFLMVYTPLQAPIQIPAQQLHTPARKGFTVVEWGGLLQNELLN